MSPSCVGGDTRACASRVSGGVGRGPKGLLRFDSARQTSGECAEARGGPFGVEADSHVASSASGGAAGRKGRPQQVEPTEEGDASGRGDFTAAGQCVSALVRQG